MTFIDRRFSSLRWLPLWSLLVWLTPLATVQGEAYSVEQFVAQKDKWDRLAGTTWTIEGRYAGLGANGLKFMKCDLPFVLKDPLPRLPATSNVLEVTGTLEKDRDELLFRVGSVRSRPSDLELVRLKRGGIDPLVPGHWYEIAGWALGRGRFYNDQLLLSEAQKLFGEGAEAERRLLDRNDAAGLLALAGRAAENGVEPLLVDQFRHEALRRKFNQARARQKPELLLLLGEISRLLPGAAERLPKATDPMRRDYEQDPLGTYSSAKGAERRHLQRLFYLEVCQFHHQQMLDAAGRNGFEVARQLEVQAPELHQLAESFRDRQQQWQLEHIETLTRQDLFEFAQRCQDRGQEDVAREGKTRWLKSREARLRADGARGLVELGEDWFSLLEDENGAARYFIEAYDANPEYTPATTWLTEHEFVYLKGKWVKETQALLADPRAAAIREGRLEVGMRVDDVRAAIGGSPSATVRLASGGRVIDLWVYEQAGIIVRFERSTKDSEGVVAAIDKIPSKTKTSPIEAP